MNTTDRGDGQARLLDVTRLVSRAGRTPTGIDRVERAWLDRFVQGDFPAFGLVRTNLGYLLLDRAGLQRLAGALSSRDHGRIGLLARLTSRRPDAVRAVETMLRRVAIARATRWRLGAMLKAHVPRGTVAFNVGHANLTDATLSALRGVPDMRLVVMIHDTIPLDWPDLQRENTARAFATKFRAAAGHADALICPSQSAAADIRRHLAPKDWPPVTVTPLGVEPAVPDKAALPPGLPPDEPYFVALGTIEPRKNHALLLDVWERLGPDAPWLVICGARGWRNEETFARLDRQPPRLREVAGLSDGAVAALLAGARALLFPSLAEGYGLPLAEAGALGTPVVCSDLPVCREVAPVGAIFIHPGDTGTWADVLRRLCAVAPVRQSSSPPDWQGHFKIALGVR